ncbi:MAG: hypothetical protein JW829_05980 [Pirellulales bacterium]|nr:hypothetical protein [Pirellulales bacterium]
MRASCERDLLATYPIDQVTDWLGHFPETALRHYNRVAKEQEIHQAAGAIRVDTRPETRSKKRSAIACRNGTPRHPAT